MATKTHRTLPPKAEPFGNPLTLTRQNFGTHYNTWPYDLVSANAYGSAGMIDYRATTSYGRPEKAGLDQYLDVGIVRHFRPTPTNLWDATSGLNNNVYDILLNQLDFWHQKTNRDGATLKVLFVLNLFYEGVGATVLGEDVTTAAYETNLIAYLTALLTSTRTNPSGLGYTFATHPALVAVEPSNEAVESDGNMAALARVSRITVDLFKQYKPACTVLLATGTGGVQNAFNSLMNSSTASLLTGGAGLVGSPARDGTTGGSGLAGAVTFSDLLKAEKKLSWHMYGNTEEMSLYISDNERNYLSYRPNLHDMNAIGHVITHQFKFLKSHATYYAGVAPLYGENFDNYTLWNTESGWIENFTGGVFDGGFRAWLLPHKERMELNFKFYGARIALTQDGAGGAGKLIQYAADINSDNYGVTGTITNIRNNGGQILFDIEGPVPYYYAAQHGRACSVTTGGVVNMAGHQIEEGEPVIFTNGTTPSGVTKLVIYYAKIINADTFNISATPGGANITWGTNIGGLSLLPLRYYGYPALYVSAGASGWADVGLGANQKGWVNAQALTTHVGGKTTFAVEDKTFSATPANNPTFVYDCLRVGPYPHELKEFVDTVTAGAFQPFLIPYADNNVGFGFHIDGASQYAGTYYTAENGDWLRW